MYVARVDYDRNFPWEYGLNCEKKTYKLKIYEGKKMRQENHDERKVS